MYTVLRNCMPALSFIGILSLGLAGIVSIPILLIFGTLILVSQFRRKVRLNYTIKISAYLLPIPLAVVLYYLLFLRPNIEQFISMLMLVTLLVSAIKYWSPIGDRDVPQVFALSFIHITASAVMVQDGWFAFLLFAYVCVALLGLTALNCCTDARDARRERKIPIDEDHALISTAFTPIRFRGFLVLGVVTILLIGFQTIFYFIVAPRIPVPNVLGRDRAENRTGFSDSVDLGSAGPITLNTEKVMRVLLPDDVTAPRNVDTLRWRGATFDYFDGRKWSNRIKSRVSAWPSDRDEWTAFQSYRIKDRSALKKFQIHLAATGESTLFTPAGSIILEFPEAVHLDPIQREIDGNWVLRSKSLDMPVYYNAYVDVEGQEYKAQSKLVMTDSSRAYRRLPEGLDRVKALAEEWTRGLRNPEDIAEAIVRRLNTGYRYSLTTRPEGESMSLSEFLFETKEGHCEYFATALAVMLRARGVPARMVTGYLPGEWNPRQKYFLVRQSDAHAWVEAYVADKGWIVTDASPLPSGGMTTPTGPLDVLKQYLDSFNFMWDQYVIGFQNKDQVKILTSTVLKIDRMISAIKKYFGRNPVMAPGTAAATARETFRDLLRLVPWLVLATGTGFLAIRLRRKSWRRYRLPKQKSAALSENTVKAANEFLRLIRYCEKRSRTKLPGETYREFSSEIETTKPKSFEGLTEASDIYYRLRFSGGTNGQRDLEELRAIARRIVSRKS